MTDVLRAYALLDDACGALDKTGDHAVAAYIGHGMALLEIKYGIDPDAYRRGGAAEIGSSQMSLDRSTWA